MKVEQILDMYTNDSKMSDDIETESRLVSNLHSKYLRILSEERSKKRGLEIERKKLASILRQYYSGGATAEMLAALNKEQYRGPKVLRQDMDDVIEQDSDMIVIDTKILMYREREEVLLEIVKGINNRSYLIRNTMEWLKFIGGK